VLLLPGAGRQLIEWEPGLIEGIVQAGYRVIAMDQRDTGLSTHFDDAGKAPLAAMQELRKRRPGDGSLRSTGIELAYGLDDMAADAVGLLDSCSIARAHVVGFSLGGSVAQQLAVTEPARVRSLTSVMSSTGDPLVGQPDRIGSRALLRSPPPDRTGAIETMLEARRLISTPGEFDETWERSRVARAFDRSFDPAGTGRQLAALWRAGDRSALLATVSAPTLVVHGSADRLVHVSGGRATAAAIPGARLLVAEGMGHDLPRRHVGMVVEEIVAHFEASDS
jgi:pimeloyl-ACP methyl ester carboxylesterase